MRIYIAGKYGAHSLPSKERLRNTMKAIEAGRKLILMGHNPFIPHLLHFVHEGWEVDIGQKYYELDTEWLKQCDAILMLDSWKESPGARKEESLAIELGISVYMSIDEIPYVSSPNDKEAIDD